MHTHHINHKTGFSKIHPSIKDYHFSLYLYCHSTHLLLSLQELDRRYVSEFGADQFVLVLSEGAPSELQ